MSQPCISGGFLFVPESDNEALNENQLIATIVVGLIGALDPAYHDVVLQDIADNEALVQIVGVARRIVRVLGGQ